ncbi:hypothetical protein DYB26_011388 [Aphanomyces astaci]|uniref:Peptidase A2 domain-containing protein n=1 Tax=Aphanomyces astaci TaxID=112090 RepID=A0A397EUQ8_APHAT|nr:hypothetical protein DYB31_012942 [Aphanomyces astaci]RHZ06046.1 hypothetical protein DYB26_011388 [Aphanomyces astaci]
MFDFGKSHGDVTEAPWGVAVQFNTKILDADSRWVLHQDGKLVVGIITKAIKPVPVQLALTTQLQLQRNKVLKSDVFCYVKWLRQFAIGYQLYGGMEEEKSLKLPGRGAAEGKLAASSTFQPDAEVKKLMDDFHQPRRRSVNFVSSTKPANSMECQASIEDFLTLPKVLLDSGSDDTLVSEGLLVALERLGASLNVETKPRLMLKRYGETTKSLHVTRQVQFKTVTLETSIGPLVLRGLRAWVEENKLEIDVLIGRPVMGRLGFSVDGMLDALKQRRVWDMAEAGDADQTSANMKWLQEAFQEDPEVALYAEDVACSTPAIEKPAGQDGEIKRILDGKIAEAIQLGLSPAHEGELRRILDDHADVFRLDFGQALPVDVEPLKYG